MSTTEIVKNSLKYPLNDYKKIFIFAGLLCLAEIILMGGIFSSAYSFSISHGNFTFLNILITIIGLVFFLIFLLVILGYIYRIISQGINLSSNIPTFNNFKSLLSDGFKLFLTKFAYNLIPLILFFIGGFLVFNIGFSPSTIFTYEFPNPNSFIASIGNFIIIIGFLLAIIFYFLEIIAVNNLIKNNGKISYAFKFEEILEKIKAIGYFKFLSTIIFALIIIIIVFLSCQSLFMIFNMVLVLIPVIGFALSFIFNFILLNIVEAYLIIFLSRTYGLLYNE